jgi:hypothetical protein
LSDEFKVAIVAGAVTGCGLTVIANTPNPVGVSILKGRFDQGVVHAGKLLIAALTPTPRQSGGRHPARAMKWLGNSNSSSYPVL